MFSGSGFDMQLNEEGAYFIDRDGTHFRHVLNYLRGCFDPETLGSAAARRELLVEADFYNLTGLCHLLQRVQLPFQGSATAENGVMHWLGTGRGTRAWANPCDGGFVSVGGTCALAYKQNLVTRSAQYTGPSGACSTQPTQHILIELAGGLRVEPTHYSLRYGGSCHQPKCWKLEAAQDSSSTEFVLLSEHMNDTSIQLGGNVAAWAVTIPETAPVRAFGIFRLSCHSSAGGHSCLHIGCFEVYGTVHNAHSVG
jgi:hypothetical protein